MHLAEYLATIVILIAIPGPDVLVVLRSALLHGRGFAMAAMLGAVSGTALHTMAASLGLSALIVASPQAFEIFRVVGVVYLAIIGLQALRRAFIGEAVTGTEVSDVTTAPQRSGAFWRGLFTDVSNPKMLLIFVTLLPQFLSTPQNAPVQLFLLGVLFWGVASTWLITIALGASRLRPLLSRRLPQRILNTAAGVVFLSFGARLALES